MTPDGDKKIRKKSGKKSPVKKPTLKAKREMFCHLYAKSGECFGNATRAYMKAYKVNEKSASASSIRLLEDTSISKRINELLDITISDEVVDRELAFCITQYSNWQAKIAGIREYNRVKNRVADKEIRGTIVFKREE